MAKKEDLIAEAQSLGINTEQLSTNELLETAIKQAKAKAEAAKAAPKKSNNLFGVSADHKLRLYKYNNKVVYMTLEEALKPYNFKQLSPKSKMAITKGTSATKLVSDLAKERS